MAGKVTEEGPHPVDRHVGRRMAEKRISMGFTQTDLARALELTFQQVQKYEKGTNRVSASKLWDTSQCLDVDIDYFFTGLSNDAASPDEVPPVSPDFPTTRQSLEIVRLSRQLSTRQQKLALDLITAMASSSP